MQRAKSHRDTPGRPAPWLVRTLPVSVRAVRVLLYVTAGLTVMAALDTWMAANLDGGPDAQAPEPEPTRRSLVSWVSLD